MIQLTTSPVRPLTETSIRRDPGTIGDTTAVKGKAPVRGGVCVATGSAGGVRSGVGVVLADGEPSGRGLPDGVLPSGDVERAAPDPANGTVTVARPYSESSLRWKMKRNVCPSSGWPADVPTPHRALSGERPNPDDRFTRS